MGTVIFLISGSPIGLVSSYPQGGAVRLLAVLVVLCSPWCDARGEDPEASLKEEKI
jgi:hypothetical protein